MILLKGKPFFLLVSFLVLGIPTILFCQEVHTIEKMVFHHILSSSPEKMHSKSIVYDYSAGKKIAIIGRLKAGFTEKGHNQEPKNHIGVYKYYYDENGKLLRIKSPFISRRFQYNEDGQLKSIQFKAKAGQKRFLPYDRMEFIYDKKGRVVKITTYNKGVPRSENSYQYHREKNFVKRIVTKDGQIHNIAEIHLQEAPVAFNFNWYELIDPSEPRFELFADIMNGFPSHIVCLSENAICDQKYTYTLEESRLIMKHEWENNIDGKISNHEKIVVFYFKEQQSNL